MADSNLKFDRQGLQYGRKCQLIVSSATLGGVDLSNFKIKFAVKRSDTITPNTADIRVYNLSDDTAWILKNEFTEVLLQAGYEGNYGVIFQGNIKQIIIGRESATDTFIDIVAGDGDRAYNFAVVNTTIAGGSSQKDQIDASVNAMAPLGVTSGFIDEVGNIRLPRAKTMFGNARDYLRNSADSTKTGVSIQNQKVNILKKTAYLPGEVVVLTSKTGLVGTPQQTNEGINIKCLLNPNIRIATRVQVDNRSIQNFKINLSVPNSPANIPVSLSEDGVYYVLVAEHSGDNRGVEWYSSLVCLYQDPSSNPINSVQVGFGGP